MGVLLGLGFFLLELNRGDTFPLRMTKGKAQLFGYIFTYEIHPGHRRPLLSSLSLRLIQRVAEGFFRQTQES